MEGNKNADKSEQTSSFYPKNLDEVLELIGKEKHKSVELKEKKQAVLNEFASFSTFIFLFLNKLLVYIIDCCLKIK